MSIRPVKVIGSLAIAAALTLGAVACSSDSSSKSSDTTAKSNASTTMAPKSENLVQIASNNADFSTLVGAVKTAGLVDTLSGKGPFTVFAPTNAAFDALPEGLLEKLLLPENVAVLTAILTYHVVPGKVMSADVTAGDVATVEGSTIAITTDGGVKVNGANVVSVDVAASNGVIHVIDQVIVPPTVDVASL